MLGRVKVKEKSMSVEPRARFGFWMFLHVSSLTFRSFVSVSFRASVGSAGCAAESGDGLRLCAQRVSPLPRPTVAAAGQQTTGHVRCVRV